MKELYLLFGIGVGVVAGALLYKHNAEVKKVVNKGENAIRKEISSMAGDVQKVATPKTQTSQVKK